MVVGQLDKKIILFGSNGLLGTSFLKNYRYKNNIITSSLHKNADLLIDIANFEVLKEKTKNIDCNIIINFSGYTDVDLCEKNKNLAKEINISGVKNLVKLSRLKSSKLIHISTDHVYNENKYNDEENVCLTNYYALSKYHGELEALKYKSLILRTNFFGKSYSEKKSFSDQLINRAFKEKKVTLFNDVYFNPLNIDTICKIINNIIENNKFFPGIYNLGSINGISKGKFIIKMLTKLKIDCEFINESIENYYNNRPKNMLMNTKKFERIFDIQLPTLDEQINEEFSKKIYN